MERLGHIYLITNSINDKVYVGQTIRDIDDRFREHCHDTRGNSKLHEAIQKYGWKNFKIELLEDVPLPQLDDAEIKWIRHYNSVNNGYNICLGGSGVPVPTAKVGVVENNLIFSSKEEMARIISSITCWTVSTLRHRLAISLERPEKDFLGYHLIYLPEDTIPSDDNVLEDWAKTLSVRYQGKHVYCDELDKEFETIAEAAKFLIDNGIYVTQSKTPIQSVVTSIGKVINGKTEYIKGKTGPLHFSYIPGISTKNTGGEVPGKKTAIYCPQLDKTFESQIEAARYMLENKIWINIKLKTAKLRISDVTRGAFPDYKGYTFQRVE